MEEGTILRTKQIRSAEVKSNNLRVAGTETVLGGSAQWEMYCSMIQEKNEIASSKDIHSNSVQNSSASVSTAGKETDACQAGSFFYAHSCTDGSLVQRLPHRQFGRKPGADLAETHAIKPGVSHSGGCLLFIEFQE